MCKRYEDRVVIVTGSSMGIGFAIARALLAEGARVVVNSRDERRSDEAARSLREGSGLEPSPQVVGVAADVASESGAARLVHAAEGSFGRLDVVVNNAGVSMIRRSDALTLNEWQTCLAVDLTGAFLVSREAGRHFMANGGGTIVNVASITSFSGFPNRAAYASAKHGLVGLTETLAAEWAQYRIRVNAVAPGYVATPMDDEDVASGDYTQADVTQRTPMGRMGTPEEIASAVLFLASDDASFITGSTLAVDGGWLAYGGWGDASAPNAPRAGS